MVVGAPLLHGPDVQLDLRAGGGEHLEAGVGGPLEEGAQVVAVSVEGPSLVAGQERSSGQLGLVGWILVRRQGEVSRHGQGCHGTSRAR